jgi:RND family efflux transporter MFP subunit
MIMRSRAKQSIAALSAVLPMTAVLVVAACGPGGEPQAEEGPAPVTIRVVGPEQITEEVFAGTRLEGDEEAMIYPAMGGRVQEVLVSEGDSVSAGQHLVRLATDRQVTAGVATAQAAIAAARANLDNARKNYDRLSSLLEAGAVSQQQLDGAETAVESAEAQLQQAYAGNQQALSTRANAYIDAPFDGRIGRIWVSEGSMAGGGPILSIANSSALTAKVLLPERYLPQLQENLPAYVSITAYDGRNYPGVVSSAARSVDPVSGLVPVRIALDNSGGELLPGMTGRAAVAVETADSALVVPEIALRRTGQGFELVVVEDGVARIVPVETGISNRGRVQVTSGLESGDSVVTEGQFRVSDGDRVEVVE